jgi:hypothetical protein
LAIGQNLLIWKLRSAVPRFTAEVAPDQVIAVGATGLELLAPSPVVLDALRRAYAESVLPTFILALVAACFAFPPACGMERVNIKHVAEERRLKLQADHDGSERQGEEKEKARSTVEEV